MIAAVTQGDKTVWSCQKCFQQGPLAKCDENPSYFVQRKESLASCINEFQLRLSRNTVWDADKRVTLALKIIYLNIGFYQR